MLVIPPADLLTVRTIATALLTVALTGLIVTVVKAVQRKVRITKGLAPVPGPKGSFLLGYLPEVVKNIPRRFEFQVCLSLSHMHVCTHLLRANSCWCVLRSCWINRKSSI